MSLDETREFIMQMDSERSITLVPTLDSATIVLTAEDVESVVIIEMTQAEIRQLVMGLLPLMRG